MRAGRFAAPIALSIAIHGVALGALRGTVLRPPPARAARADAPPVDVIAVESPAAPEVPPVRCVPETKPPAEAPRAAVPRPAAGLPEAKPQPKPVQTVLPESPPPPPAAVMTATGPSADAAPAGSGSASGLVDPRSAGAGAGAASTAAPARGAGGVDEGMGAYVRLVHARLGAAAVMPEQARREGREGTVKVRLVLAPDGRVLEASVVGGVADPVLRDAALAAVRRAGTFPPLPASVGAAGPQAFGVPLRFGIVRR